MIRGSYAGAPGENPFFFFFNFIILYSAVLGHDSMMRERENNPGRLQKAWPCITE